MTFIFPSKSIIFLSFAITISGCAYFNTFYNAKEYFADAEKIRLQKEGEAIPITAMDKYGKAVQKCQKVLKDYPESKFRIEAILLMAKSRFYRSDYEIALDNLKIIFQEGSSKQIEEAKYWKALCKWKKGNTQTGFTELTDLLESSNSKNILSKCHLSLADIAKELKDPETTIFHLEEGARLTRNRDEKGVIYGRLAEMAYNRGDYDLANEGYSNVIAHSLSKEKIENAHLQILKILRLEKKYRPASRKIKSMLADDKFKGIAGDLELELVQLYRAQGELSEIESRLESIVKDYQRTSVSADAYYQLGMIYTSEKWDLSKAKEFYSLVSKESSKSLFSPMAKSRVKSIDNYQEAQNDLATHQVIIQQDSLKSGLKQDSSSLSVSVQIPKRTIPELHYQIGDIEAFSFGRFPEAIASFNNIISKYPDSPFHAKAIFTSVFVFEKMNDLESSEGARKRLLIDYPNSDYASYLSDEEIKIEKKEQETLYEEAEQQIRENPSKALALFKNVLIIDDRSDLAISAAYTIGHYYDQEALLDSAIKYYQWINNNHPRSDHSKISVNRIKTLELVLSNIEPDSSLNSNEDDN